MELDGVGSPVGLAARIHELDPHLPLDFSIEDVCRRLDIDAIEDKPATSFAAMLLMHPDRAWGSIVVAEGTSPRRRRFSIGHELGHFLIGSHRPLNGAQFACSHADMHLDNPRGADLARKMEAEANRFAASLLMPPRQIRSNLKSRQPDLGEVLQLAGKFNVSKAAMARSYVEAHGEILALIVVKGERIAQAHRPVDFPWIAPRIGDPLPADSIANRHQFRPGDISQLQQCDPESWLGSAAARKVGLLSEQVLVQRDGWAMILLHAEGLEAD